jgi:hypothetical protein
MIPGKMKEFRIGLMTGAGFKTQKDLVLRDVPVVVDKYMSEGAITIGQSFIGNYRLHYDLWMNANGPFPAGGAGSTQHHTSGLGTAGNRVQWDTGTADGAWFATDGEGQASDTSATLPDWRVYVGTTLQAATTGDYAAGNTTSARGNNHPYYENVFPALKTAPAAQGLQVGGLDVGTIGFAWRNVIVNKTGSTVEWFIDGLKIATVTNVTSTQANGAWKAGTLIPPPTGVFPRYVEPDAAERQCFGRRKVDTLALDSLEAG